MRCMIPLACLLCCAAAFAADPAPPPPSPLDRKLSDHLGASWPQWFRPGGQVRFRGEGRTGLGFRPGNDDAYSLVRTRVEVDLLPSRWLRFSFQGQDARAPGFQAGRPQGAFRDPFDIRQAFVQLGHAESGLKLTVGRQLLLYGAQRLIGPLDWTNTSRNWDAVKLEIGGPAAKLDVFASSVVVTDPTRRINQPRRGVNLHGAYSSFRKLIPGSVLETYLLWKTSRLAVVSPGVNNRSNTYSGGFRLAAPPGTPALHGFDYQAEFVRQWGNAGPAGRSAWAGYAIGGYTLPGLPKPLRVSMEYSYASGQDRQDGVVRTFDHLYGTNHLFYGLVDLIGWQNIHNPRVGFDVKPWGKLHLLVDYHWFWLASAGDALYDVAGTPIVRGRPGSSRRVGTELDFQVSWAAARQWTVGGGLGHLFPGALLRQNTSGSPATFPYVFAQYAF